MTGTVTALAPMIATPHIEYGQLSPILLVFAVALAGVLVEAFAPRFLRRSLQLTLTLRFSVHHQKALQYPPTHDKAAAPLCDAKTTIIRVCTSEAALQHLAMSDTATAGNKVVDFVSEHGT